MNCMQDLNIAMKELAQNDDKIVFLGEDIKAPYGGAFKIEKELSSMFPNRVLSMPISEESFVGMAVGMSMSGYKPIVDMMFSDFLTLSFDMILNFSSKYISMYGRKLELPLILRCANGGYRGYGATHSQSMQKYYMGMPDVSVYEMTPFHQNYPVYCRMLNEKRPCLFFEEKILYTEKIYSEGDVDGIFRVDYSGTERNWAILSSDADKSDIAILCHGGLSLMCMNAAKNLLLDDEIEVRIFIPSRLYPCEIDEIYTELQDIGKILIVEESTSGADWGCALLGDMMKSVEGRELVKNVRLLSSESTSIPSDISLEKAMLVNVGKIEETCRKILM